MVRATRHHRSHCPPALVREPDASSQHCPARWKLPSNFGVRLATFHLTNNRCFFAPSAVSYSCHVYSLVLTTQMNGWRQSHPSRSGLTHQATNERVRRRWGLAAETTENANPQMPKGNDVGLVGVAVLVLSFSLCPSCECCHSLQTSNWSNHETAHHSCGHTHRASANRADSERGLACGLAVVAIQWILDWLKPKGNHYT